MKKILLTRSIEENELLAETLSPLGFEMVLCPMVSYTNLPSDFTKFKERSNLIVTSKYAAKIIAENYLYNAKCFVVGEESASILAENPNLKISYIANDSEELKRALLSQLSSSGAGFIYFSGDIVTALFERAQRHIIYKVNYPSELSAEVINKIKSGIDYIMLYSKNCANNLMQLLLKHNLLQNIQNSVVIALSQKIADEFDVEVKIALYPTTSDAAKMNHLLVSYDKENHNN